MLWLKKRRSVSYGVVLVTSDSPSDIQEMRLEYLRCNIYIMITAQCPVIIVLLPVEVQTLYPSMCLHCVIKRSFDLLNRCSATSPEGGIESQGLHLGLVVG